MTIQKIKYLCLLLVLIHTVSTAQVVVTEQSFQDSISMDLHSWKYHAGDDPLWAGTDFDDSAWEQIDSRLLRNHMPKTPWQGIGWFRVRLHSDPWISEEPLGLYLRQSGCSEIYVNGRLLYRSKNFDLDSESLLTINPIILPACSDYVIAVRYKNPSLQEYFKYENRHFAGFKLSVAPLRQIIPLIEKNTRFNSKVQMFFTAVPLAIALLHLILYLFLPRRIGNLFYALFTFAFAAATFLDYQFSLYSWFGDVKNALIILKVHRAVTAFLIVLFLRFLYSLLYQKLPLQFWGFSALMMVAGAFAVYNPVINMKYLQIATAIGVIESMRILCSAVRNHKEGIWMIVLGTLLLFIFNSYDILLDLNLIGPIGEIYNVYFIGMIGLFICMSIYLARDYAQAHAQLIVQERMTRQEELQQRLFQAEMDRKTQELEEARKLQLAMLPKTLPTMPHLDIAVYMKTATEVGGDYYDFYTGEDGSLTVVVGDATGHGNKAGIMVVLMKSLFNMASQSFYIPDFFSHCTNIIKSMNLGNLYMAMTLLKIQGYKMILSSSGLPPVLVFRQKTQQLEEFLIKGLPLGGYRGFTYQQRKTDLSPGDTVLIMTDGYPELFNKELEILDFDRVKQIFNDIAVNPPKKIISELIDFGEKWQQGHPQQDDITFVVLKVK